MASKYEAAYNQKKEMNLRKLIQSMRRTNNPVLKRSRRAQITMLYRSLGKSARRKVRRTMENMYAI